LFFFFHYVASLFFSTGLKWDASFFDVHFVYIKQEKKDTIVVGGYFVFC